MYQRRTTPSMEGLTIEQTSSRVIIYYCTHCPLFPSFNNHWTTIIYAFFIENRLAFVMCLFIINELFSHSLHLLRKLFCTNGFYAVTMLCFVRKCFALFQYFPNVKMCCSSQNRTVDVWLRFSQSTLMMTSRPAATEHTFSSFESR